MTRKKLLMLLGSVCLALMLVVPLAVACAGPTPAPAEVKYKWKFGSGEKKGDWGCVYGDRLAELLAEKSGGQIELTVYPEGTLGVKFTDVPELVRAGVIEMASPSPAGLSSWIPEVNVFYLHFKLPQDLDQLLEILNRGEFAKVMKQLYAEAGFDLLSLTTQGWSAWTSNKPLRTLEDFAGLKFRVMPATIIVESFKAYGANPTPMAFGEVYSGLQMGLIEGQENPYGTIYVMGFYEVQDYITMAYHFPFINGQLAGLEFMEGLPEDIREMVYEASWEAAIWGTTEWQAEWNEEHLQTILKARPEIVFYELTPAERELFVAAARPVRELYLQEDIGGSRAREVLDALEADIARVVG